jgi:hypothetical protein
MAKAQIIRDAQGLFYGIRYVCPGCSELQHMTGSVTLPVTWREHPGEPESPHQAGRPHWSFNGDLEKPVFGPSVNSYWDEWTGHDTPPKRQVCHTFIGCNGAAPGQIVFLGDCTHSLKGQVVELPDLQSIALD